MKILACAAAALLLAAGSAPAQEAFAPKVNKFAPPPLTPEVKSKHHDWTGFYVGAQTGLTAGNGDARWSGDGARSSGSFGSTSSTFGAHAGYNYQFGRGIVLGGESDVSTK